MANVTGKKPGDWSCPLPDTYDKFEEAHYFLHKTVAAFHVPDEFRWNLSAFLQALYSVTGLVKKELTKRPGFDEWFKPHDKEMHDDVLLARLLEGRNIVVHRRRLQRRSTAQLGWYMGTVSKRAITIPVDPEVPSVDVMRHWADMDNFRFLGGGDSDEQLGVLRKWVLDDLAHEDEDIVMVCHRAWTRVGRVVSSAHNWLGSTFPPYDEHDTSHLPDRYDLLLAMDVPGLKTKPEPPPRSLALLSRRVWHADIRPRRVYREEPVNDSDSGWRLLKGDEDEEWFADPDVEVVPVSAMTKVYPSLAELFVLDETGDWEWDDGEEKYISQP